MSHWKVPFRKPSRDSSCEAASKQLYYTSGVAEDAKQLNQPHGGARFEERKVEATHEMLLLALGEDMLPPELLAGILLGIFQT